MFKRLNESQKRTHTAENECKKIYTQTFITSKNVQSVCKYTIFSSFTQYFYLARLERTCKLMHSVNLATGQIGANTTFAETLYSKKNTKKDIGFFEKKRLLLYIGIFFSKIRMLSIVKDYNKKKQSHVIKFMDTLVFATNNKQYIR